MNNDWLTKKQESDLRDNVVDLRVILESCWHNCFPNKTLVRLLLCSAFFFLRKQSLTGADF
jgi:hypothetical protein